MAFAYTNSKGQTYYLHGREVELNNNRQRTIYFFAKDQREGVLESVPSGWQVMEGRNALPVLSKEGGNGSGQSKSNGSGGSEGDSKSSSQAGNSGGRKSGSKSNR